MGQFVNLAHGTGGKHTFSCLTPLLLAEQMYMWIGVSSYSNVRAIMFFAHSCPTFCDPMDCSQPGSSVHRILQVRILEWVVIPPPGDLPNLGMKPTSPVSPSLAGRSFTTEPSRKPWGLGKTGNTFISTIQHLFTICL